MEYHAACTQCMRRIARCMAVALDLPPDYFDPYLTTPIASLRHMHYLPTMSDPSKVRSGLETLALASVTGG